MARTMNEATYTLAHIDSLPDAISDDMIKCPIVLEKLEHGETKRFLIDVTQEGESFNRVIHSIPPRTQPTRGFHELDNPHNWSDIYLSLSETIKEYVFFLNEGDYNVTTLAAMASYFPEVFNSYPYIDYSAAEINCGKSTATKAGTLASRYGLVVSSTSAASLYRDPWNSTFGIDEVDNQLQDRDTRAILLSVLNSGYAKGYPASRVNPDTGEVELFECFGLKFLSRVGNIPESIKNRCITINMIRSPDTLKDIDECDPFVDIRDQLYFKRLNNQDEAAAMYYDVKATCGLKNRDRQLWSPLLTMAKLVSKSVYEATLQYAKEYSQQRENMNDDPIVRALVEICLRPEYLGYEVPTVNIRDELQTILIQEGIFSDDSKKFSTRTIHGYFDSLGLLRSKKRTDGYVHYIIEKQRLENWARIYHIEGYTPENTSLSSFPPFDEDT
jgi:hypothetical protein